MTSDRTYWRLPGGRSWHIRDGTDTTDWRALCGRWPTRFTEHSPSRQLVVCALCRDVAAIRDREDALIAAEEARLREELLA